MDDHNKTDRYFSERLGSYEQDPPESSWQHIAGKLEERKKKRVVLLIFRIAAGMAILLSLGTAAFYIMRHAETIEEKLAQKNSSYETGNNHATSEPIQPSTSSNNPAEIKAYITDQTADQSVGQSSSNSSQNDQYTENPAASDTLSGNRRHEESAEAGYPLLTRIENRKTSVLSNNIHKSLRTTGNNKENDLTEEEMIALLLGDEQNNEPETIKDKPWLLGSEIAPLYSYRTISSSNLESDMVDNLNEHESGILAYAGGIHVSYSTGKRFTIQSGLYYSRYGQDKNQVQTYANRMANSDFIETNSRVMVITNSTGTINADMMTGGINTDVRSDIGVLSEMNFKYDYVSNSSVAVSEEEKTDLMVRQLFDYFEFPLLIRYKLIDRKIDFSFTGGVITNFLVGNKLDLMENGKTRLSESTSGINTINYQGSVGMGIEYPVGSKFAFTLEPRFRYYINAIDKEYGIVHPFSFGLFTGINYRF